MSIQFKRSTVSGVQPSSTNMYQGELAINLPDKRLFTMDNNNEIINIGFSKDEADSTYLPFTGGTITGPLEISNSTPFIDFHYNYSTADYTHRIIASDANTLKLVANTTEISGALKVDGSVSTTNIIASGSITASGTLTINNTVRANTFRATGGVPANDAATCGYSFDNNGDSGVFYENASTTSYGGYLNLRNDGSLCLSLNSTQAVIYPLLNAQGGIYTGTSTTQNTMSANNGIIELYSATPAIDFHFGNSSADYTSRIIAPNSTTLQLVSGNITLSGNVNASGTISSSSSIFAAGNISTNGSISANSSIVATNGVYIKDSSSGVFAFYDSKDPDSGIYNYALVQDGGAFTFNFSTVNSAFAVGPAKHIFDSNGNYTAAGAIHSTGNLTVGSAFMQTDGNIYMPWAGNYISNLLGAAKTSISIITGVVGTGTYLPVPSGYARSQCYYTVWPHYIAFGKTGGGPDGYTDTNSFSCQVNQGSGLVTVGSEYNPHNNGGSNVGYAGYIVIGVK